MFLMMWQRVNEDIGEMSFMGMKPCIYCFQGGFCLANSLENTKNEIIQV